MNALSLLGTLNRRRPHPLSSNNFCQSCNPDSVLVSHSTETTLLDSHTAQRLHCCCCRPGQKTLGGFADVWGNVPPKMPR